MLTIDDTVGRVHQVHPGRTHLFQHWIGPLTALTDVLAVVAVVALSSVGFHLVMHGYEVSRETTLTLAAMLGSIFLFGNLMQSRYQVANYIAPRGQIESVAGVWSLTLIVFLTIALVSKIIDDLSWPIVLLTFVLGIPAIGLTRMLLVSGISIASRQGRMPVRRIFLIGHEENVMSFVERCRPWNVGFEIVDVAYLRSPRSPQLGETASWDMTIADDLAAIVARTRHMQPDAVFIAMPWSQQKIIARCVDALLTTPVAIHLATEQILDRFERPRASRLGAMTSLELSRPVMSWPHLKLKRVFDLVAATLILVAITPILLLVALAIRWETNGPVLFIQRRHGFNRRAFRICKFRTMTVAEDGPIVVQARQDDVRITRVGRILRRYNIDELPQLLNVIAGHMSLVGPRPHALAHDEDFQQRISLYARRHNVKPGITGWAQVNGLRGLTDTDAKMAARIDHDLWYIDNWSFWLDIVILLRTIFSAKSFRNAG
jgi:Undecaprenyl-phosphate glucose phosphotransferase